MVVGAQRSAPRPLRTKMAINDRGEIAADTSARRGAVFIDVVAAPARLLLVGAVDIAGTLRTLVRATGWRSFVIDPRARFARPEPPH
jgi:xanthine/CO dehydrogenase XdhC/CoxF family maturation factor